MERWCGFACPAAAGAAAGAAGAAAAAAADDDDDDDDDDDERQNIDDPASCDSLCQWCTPQLCHSCQHQEKPNVKQYALLQLHKNSTCSIWPATGASQCCSGVHAAVPSARWTWLGIHGLLGTLFEPDMAGLWQTLAWHHEVLCKYNSLKECDLDNCAFAEIPIPTLAPNSLRMCSS